MKSAKFLIVFTFLLTFALQVSAQEQTPKIVWKNLQEKYDRFKDIEPTVFNDGDSPIFMPNSFSNAIEYGFIKLLKFDEEKNKWSPNYIWICGTLTKKERKYIRSHLKNRMINFTDGKT
ncbi:MAG TPA: hypothetical protein PKE69_02500 [Pyrinomonadaceae bacterium]|nr:hypothetical protein [Pyrinomonadaceae bacterium]